MPPCRVLKLILVKIKLPNTTQLKYIQGVQRILLKQYFQQLRLDVGTIVFDPQSKIFFQDVHLNEIDIRTRNEALFLLREQRIDIFLHFVNKFVSSNTFVGLTLIQSILELVLIVSIKNSETSEKTLQSASLLFEKIVDNFPPSWSVCSDFYKNLLHSPLNIEIDFRKVRMNSTDGFFSIILALLDDVFQDDDDNEGSEKSFDSMMDFQQFEKIESSKCCYMKLTRNEKIDRLFIVLNLLVKLMEIDLSIWIQRYPFQTRNFMSNPNTCPLIGHLLWKGKECGESNKIVRQVFRLFTMCIWIEFPNDKTNILARLVNLMSVAVSLAEHAESNNLISYPNIKILTNTFVTEMVKSIETFPYTIDFCTNVISKIQSPAISMLVNLRILGKFSKDYENVTLKKIVDSISNESYKQYETGRMNDAPSRRSDNESYPTYDPRNVTKFSKYLQINREEYLTLLLHLFKSYVEVYRTHDLLQSLLSGEETTSTISNDWKYKEVKTKIEKERNHRRDYTKIYKNRKRLTAAANKLASVDKIPAEPLIEYHSVYLLPSELVRYQEDLEYLPKLQGIIDQNILLGDTFEQWPTAVSQYLPN